MQLAWYPAFEFHFTEINYRKEDHRDQHPSFRHRP